MFNNENGKILCILLFKHDRKKTGMKEQETQTDYIKGFKQTPKSVKFTLKRKGRLMVK